MKTMTRECERALNWRCSLVLVADEGERMEEAIDDPGINELG